MRRTCWVQVGASTPKAEAGGLKMRGPNPPRLWKNNMRFSMETSSCPSCGFSHNPLYKLPSWLDDVNPPPSTPLFPRSDAPKLSLVTVLFLFYRLKRRFCLPWTEIRPVCIFRKVGIPKNCLRKREPFRCQTRRRMCVAQSADCLHVLMCK